MSGLTITWDGVASSTLDGFVAEKVDRNLFGEVRDAAVAVPGRGGDYVFPEERGNRTIAARCQVNGPINERRSRVEAVAEWLDKRGYTTLAFSDKPGVYWRAYLRTTPNVDEWRRQGKFVLEWSAEPYSYAVSTSSQSATATGGSDSDTFTIPDARGTCMILEVTPLNGTLTGWEFTLNGSTLVSALGVGLTSGSTMTISSCDFTITAGANGDTMLTGAFIAYGAWSVDASGEFGELVPGDNDWAFSWTGTATNVRLRFLWRERGY